MYFRVAGFLPQLQRWINKRKKTTKKEKKEKNDKPNATPKRRGTSNNSSSNAFDERNEDTFSDCSSREKGWSVADMFAANAKLTGAEYTYDGNPHRFGDMHPRYVRYDGLVSPMRTGIAAPSKDSSAMSARTIAAFGCIAEASEEDENVGEYFPRCFQFDMSAIHEALLFGMAA